MPSNSVLSPMGRTHLPAPLIQIPFPIPRNTYTLPRLRIPQTRLRQLPARPNHRLVAVPCIRIARLRIFGRIPVMQAPSDRRCRLRSLSGETTRARGKEQRTLTSPAGPRRRSQPPSRAVSRPRSGGLRGNSKTASSRSRSSVQTPRTDRNMYAQCRSPRALRKWM